MPCDNQQVQVSKNLEIMAVNLCGFKKYRLFLCFVVWVTQQIQVLRIYIIYNIKVLYNLSVVLKNTVCSCAL